jgi:hypothetical protein
VSAAISAATTCGSNCVPLPARRSAIASPLSGDATCRPPTKVRPLQRRRRNRRGDSCGKKVVGAHRRRDRGNAGPLDDGDGGADRHRVGIVLRSDGEEGVRALGRPALLRAPLYNRGFESGSLGCTLSGGAKVVAGNEPFFLSGDGSNNRSLLLPSGSSASGTVCFALGDWHLRMVMRNVGSRTGGLRVQVVVPSLVGIAAEARPTRRTARVRLPSGSRRSASAPPTSSTTSTWIRGREPRRALRAAAVGRRARPPRSAARAPDLPSRRPRGSRTRRGSRHRPPRRRPEPLRPPAPA